MEKLVRRGILRSIIIMFAILFIVTSFFILNTRRKVEERGLDDILTQIVYVYNENKDDIDKIEKEFIDEYLNKALTIETSLTHQEITKTRLEYLQKLLDIDAICLIDSTGRVVYTSRSAYQNQNILEQNSSQELRNLILGKSKEPFVDMQAKPLYENAPTILMTIHTSIQDIAAIQIGVQQEKYDEYMEPHTIESIIRQMPTIEERSILVVDRTNGQIVSVTQNNSQHVDFGYELTTQQFISKLEGLNNAGLVRINGSLRYLQTKVLDNYIFCAYIDTSQVYDGVMYDMLTLLIFLIIISTVIYFLIHVVIKKYVLDDLMMINENIQELLKGHYPIEFKSHYDTEFKVLNTILNKWQMNYKHKSQRMSRFIHSIDEHIAIFESLGSIHSVFFSDNLIPMLNLTDEQILFFKTEPEAFNKYLYQIMENKDQDGIVLYQSKFLQFEIFENDDEFYGLIIDKTSDIEELNIVKTQLEMAEQKMYRDSLSGVYNREGLELLVVQALNAQKKGTLFLFDIDNFKAINDNEGHPQGDKAIQIFVKCLQKYFSLNMIARLGGDEFAVFIHENMSLQQIEEKCENVLNDVLVELKHFHEKYQVSASIGVAHINEDITTYDQLYHVADEALYKAKVLGKGTYYIAK